MTGFQKTRWHFLTNSSSLSSLASLTDLVLHLSLSVNDLRTHISLFVLFIIILPIAPSPTPWSQEVKSPLQMKERKLVRHRLNKYRLVGGRRECRTPLLSNHTVCA
ncbi:hypothetical protein LX36DRAFT_180532 [Colletotrichum falcatum]|nr:hypothetical protein LX36DRAFT_180532 [Colletotrichum falcatum]